MIEKNLYLLWFGSKKPSYVDMVKNVYSEINKDFNVQLIFEPDINNTKNTDILTCAKYILNKKDDKDNSHKFWQKVLNVYKFYIVNKYGGIYVDCDTFPIKPFDEELLSKGAFMTQRFSTVTKQTAPYKDIFFFGREKQQNLDMNDILNKDNYPPIDIVYETHTDLKYKMLKEKFFRCDMKFGEHFNDNTYIDHYNHFSWNCFDKNKSLVEDSIFDKNFKYL